MGQGRNTEGRDTEGRNTEGRNTEGRNTEGRNTEGRNTEGRMPLRCFVYTIRKPVFTIPELRSFCLNCQPLHFQINKMLS